MNIPAFPENTLVKLVATHRDTCVLRDKRKVQVYSTWEWSPKARGWELLEHWVPGEPRLSTLDRKHLHEQLVAALLRVK